MKHYKTLVSICCLSLIIGTNLIISHSYLNNDAKSQTVSITLGYLKIQTDNNSENQWKYVPIDNKETNNLKNDLVVDQKLTTDINVNNLRPGDAFEKTITITNTGTIASKIKITKSESFKNSPFHFSIKLDGNYPKIAVQQDTKNPNIWYINNLKSNDKLAFLLRIEIPLEITNKDINPNNFELSNNALEFIDITATQWNNPTWN